MDEAVGTQASLFEYDTRMPAMRSAGGSVHGHGEYLRAVRRSVDAAHRSGRLDDEHAAAVSLLVAGARSLEAFEQIGKPYGSQKLIPAMTEVLRELHLTVDSAGTDEGPSDIDKLLAELATNDEQADAAPAVRHRP